MSKVTSTELIEKLRKTPGVVIFGVGHAGQEANRYLIKNKITVAFFCDNNKTKWGSSIENVPVIEPAKLYKLDKNQMIVCIASDWARDIASQLSKKGIQNFFDFTYSGPRWDNHFNSAKIKKSQEQIKRLRDGLEDILSKTVLAGIIKFRSSRNPLDLVGSSYDQYLHPAVKPKPGEIVFDVGAWQGDTALTFLKATGYKAKIYAFEPEKENYKALTLNLAKRRLREKVFPIRAGLWNSSTSLFLSGGEISSKLLSVLDRPNKKSSKIFVIKLDDFTDKNQIIPHFIKMDVEGAEMKALRGSMKIIRKYAPKLSISIYHLPDDLWTIPLFIKKIRPDYRLFLGHHSQSINETVLYATI